MDSSTSGKRTNGRAAKAPVRRAEERLAAADQPSATAGATRVAKQSTGGRGPKVAGMRSLLFGSPREVLARISAGDPLEIRARVGIHLRDRHVLFDADRLHLRAIAHVARQALHLRASDGLEAFLRSRIGDAARELRREDRVELKNGGRRSVRSRPAKGRETSKTRTTYLRPVTHFDELARPLGLKPSRVRAACARFNEADSADRKACFELLVDGADIDALAIAEGTTVTEIARRARRALEVALGALDGEAS